ncbi:hydrolase [Marinobacterium sp. MBR-109]|uniref:hydrolase n=1 Tax=Marinobacterium sp. MBR-109 TaxID=3156462 RepID=UPI0033912E35
MRQSYYHWLPDQQALMLEQTIALAEINSGTFNVTGVNAVADRLIKFAVALGAVEQRIELPHYRQLTDRAEWQEQPLGQAVQLRKHPDAPLQLLLMGHLDTVYGADHPFQQICWLDAERLNGPGVTDMKGGLVVALHALAALEASPLAGRIGWRWLLNPDEEIGSPCSADLIARCAAEADMGLVFEPALADGSLAGARKGSGNFSVRVTGRAAHAGREHHLGRNAIRALCDFISGLDDLNGQQAGVTINPGYIHGGGAVNVVPDRAMARFNIRIEQPEDELWCLQQLEHLQRQIRRQEGIQIELDGRFGRKPKPLGPHLRLFERLRQIGQELGTELSWLPSGGCCDGNNLAAAGLPNIDTLGVCGGAIHSSDEFLLVASLAERARLSAALLFELAQDDPVQWRREGR